MQYVKGLSPVPVCAGLLYTLQMPHVRASCDACTTQGSIRSVCLRRQTALIEP